MNRTRRGAFSGSLVLALSLLATACGEDALTRAESLPLRTYPADRDFRLSLIMTSCSDACSDYEASECSVDVNTEDRVIEVDASVGYSERDGVDRATCALTCGKPVVAHCDVSAVPAGTYTVVSGTFSATIDVR
jgi:hypothetical protein